MLTTLACTAPQIFTNSCGSAKFSFIHWISDQNLKLSCGIIWFFFTASCQSPKQRQVCPVRLLAPHYSLRKQPNIQSQFLSSQDSISSPCWKELQNKTCVSSTGCLFTVNRTTLCSLSPPLSPQNQGVGRTCFQDFLGVTLIPQHKSHTQRASSNREKKSCNSKMDKVTSLQTLGRNSYQKLLEQTNTKNFPKHSSRVDENTSGAPIILFPAHLLLLTVWMLARCLWQDPQKLMQHISSPGLR